MMIYNLYDESEKLVGDHEIADDDTVSFTIASPKVPSFPFFGFFKYQTGDSIYLNFANERYLTYSKKQKDGIFARGKYRQVEITEYNIVHYWEFTEEDYENATVIEP